MGEPHAVADAHLTRTPAGVLELREITKRYPGSERPAVEGLSLTVPAGQVLVLIGPSGCGKTTALKMINRLVEPTAGEILIDGRSVRDRDPSRLRREIGYVIQQVGLMPHLTVAGNVGTVPRLLGWDRARIRRRVDELLELIGLDPGEYRDRYPAQLSGGQQQRVGLARALAGDPPVMLMDEPFSAVDPITRERLQNDFLRLHRAVPKTVVFVSHDIDEAVKMADQIAVMRDGHLVQVAPPDELLAHPVDEFVADFVGADRALKRLSLARVEQLDLRPPPAVVLGEPAAAVTERIADGEITPVGGSVLVVDRAGRPLQWLRVERIEAAGVVATTGAPPPEPLVDSVATLRDALSAVLEASASHGVVVDPDGVAIGIFDVQEIALSLSGAVVGGPDA
jgi:osmoprotectant transport system ATP-binding protein